MFKCNLEAKVMFNSINHAIEIKPKQKRFNYFTIYRCKICHYLRSNVSDVRHCCNSSCDTGSCSPLQLIKRPKDLTLSYRTSPESNGCTTAAAVLIARFRLHRRVQKYILPQNNHPFHSIHSYTTPKIKRR